jgi:2-polyprenyl-3-methyl-5-hydroxy-6-metoxy-1,4-benzoquinol methylase
MKQWYEELFTNYAKKYDEEEFTKGTLSEVDFIEKEIGFNKASKILDVGCGTGRHSIELAKRGYKVVGIDLSLSQLAHAKEKAKLSKVRVDFIQKDARDFDYKEGFDHALMLCEGAFSLMETDKMNYVILENVFKSIKPSGKFIFTALNALFPLYHQVKDFLNAEPTSVVTENDNFDLMTLRLKSTVTATNDYGELKTLDCNERYFMPSEIYWYLKSIGFSEADIFGSKLGAFSREDKLTPNDFELLVVAVK